MRTYLLLALLLIVLGGGFYALTTPQLLQKTHNSKLAVTTSFYPLYFFASEIGGGKAEVFNITPAGSEPHDYEPTTQDIARIEDGDILIINGTVESWGSKINDMLQGTDVQIVRAGDGVVTHKDPHVWLDPQLAKKEAAKITEAFVHKDQANASYYQTNEKLLNGKLDALDADYKTGLASCQSRDIITTHAAFGYLANRYGLNQIPISGLSPDAEPSTQQLADVAKFAKEHDVKYIFFESLVSPKLAATIANEVGAETLVLDPLEGIPQDEIKQGENYFTIMENNLANLKTALRCAR